MLTEPRDEEFTSVYKSEAIQRGQVVPLVYDTYFYAKDKAAGDVNSHSSPIQKKAYVYLPYGYNEKVQYNVLYLLHGGGDTAESWFSMRDTESAAAGEGYGVYILDNLFARGEAEPCIVVTPGMYDMGEGEELTSVRGNIPDCFAYELRDLIVAVESTYSTWAKDISHEGLVSSRDHRAMAGLSMGSITTWHSGIVQNLDIISWFCNMSGGPSADEAEAVTYTEEKIIPALQEGEKSGYGINMMLSINGIRDMALEPHVKTHLALLKLAENSKILTVGENYDFVVLNGAHMWTAWDIGLYNLMQVFFR